MKTIKLITLLLCLCTLAFAQAPEEFNYQGVARDAAGQPLANQSITLRLAIRHNTSGGTTQYRERHNVTTNDYGLYNVAIGTGTVEVGSMSAVTWGSGNKYLQVQIDPNGGTTYTNLGSEKLLSTPYALNAANVEFTKNASGFIVQKDITDRITIGSATGQSANKLHVTSSTGVTELVDFKATSLNSAQDILNLEAPSSAASDAQFIEAAHGSNIKFRLDVSGDLTTEGEIRREQTGSANMVPIAYGYVTTTGTMPGAKTSNVSCTRISAGTYNISITGESYYFQDYVPSGTIMDIGTIRFSSTNGNLRVYTYNSSGTLADRRFYFTVFKP